MVNRRAGDAAALPPQTPIAPVAKRKRRASCLGEQERRERKRAIDREAQRSLREKTKTHIAELERTIEILRDQDRNGTTASLLSEIDGLRAENERLKDVIDSVKSVVGLGFGMSSKETTAAVGPPSLADDGGDDVVSFPATSAGQQSPKPRTLSSSSTTRPSLPTSIDQPTTHVSSEPIRSLDLDGMTVMTDLYIPPVASNRHVDMESTLSPVQESSEEEVEETPWGNAPATATWAPMMEEIFGPNWRCPSPTILHIGNPDNPTTLTSSSICPIWEKSNELFAKVFSYHHRHLGNSKKPPFFRHNLDRSDIAEAGLLYIGIKQGWESLPSSSWMESPALTILKQVDELLFVHLPNVERLAVAYKSFKLLKYYLNATKDELDRVPDWLRPSFSQSSTAHPIALDFFAWPTLRSRLLNNHATIFQSTNLSRCYSRYLRFDWPFSLEDAFFLDESSGTHYPSPLFERYHGDLKYWSVDEQFFDTFPEMKGDIEGDRNRAG